MSIKLKLDLWISYLKILYWAFLTNQEAFWPFHRSCHLLLPKVTTRWRFLAKFSVRGTKSLVTINRPSPNPFSLRIEYFLQNFFVNSAQIWRFCSFSIIAWFRYHSKQQKKYNWNELEIWHQWKRITYADGWSFLRPYGLISHIMTFSIITKKKFSRFSYKVSRKLISRPMVFTETTRHFMF